MIEAHLQKACQALRSAYDHFANKCAEVQDGRFAVVNYVPGVKIKSKKKSSARYVSSPCIGRDTLAKPAHTMAHAWGVGTACW